jgi:hypothetical protein
MKFLAVLASIICLVGCRLSSVGYTTLQPITDNDAGLQHRIVAGQLIKPGDHVWVQTIDRKVRRLTVISIDVNNIIGERESIAIDQIISIEKRQLNVGKTLTLVCATIVGILIIIVVVGLHHGVGLPAGAA